MKTIKTMALILLCTFFVKNHCYAQMGLDTSYFDGYNVRQFGTPCFLGNDSALVLENMLDTYTKDSIYKWKVRIGIVNLKTGAKRELNTVKKPYGGYYATTHQFSTEKNKFMVTELDSDNYKIGFSIVSTTDNWRTYQIKAIEPVYDIKSILFSTKIDNNYYVSGRCIYDNTLRTYIAQFDSSFNLLLNSIVPIEESPIITSIQKNGDRLILSGYVSPATNLDYPIQICTDLNGNLYWHKLYTESKYTNGRFFNNGVSINQKYLNFGNIYDSTAKILHGFLNLIDESGNIIWEKFIAIKSGSFLIQKTIKVGNNLYAVGQVDSSANGNTTPNAILLKFNLEGDLQWYQVYQHYPNASILYEIESTDSQILLCGRVERRLKNDTARILWFDS